MCGSGNCCQNGSSGSCSCHFPRGVRVIRAISCLVLAVVIFMLGMSVGMRVALRRASVGGQLGAFHMARSNSAYGQPFAPRMMWRGTNEDGSLNGDTLGEASSTSWFGAITKIDGGNITIMDNAAKEDMITSQANTIIVSQTGEQPLSALKVGQAITAVGGVDASSTLEAAIIRVN